MATHRTVRARDVLERARLMRDLRSTERPPELTACQVAMLSGEQLLCTCGRGCEPPEVQP